MVSEAGDEPSELEKAATVLLNQQNYSWKDVRQAREVLLNDPDRIKLLAELPALEAILKERLPIDPGYARLDVERQAETLREFNKTPDLESLPPFALEIYRALQKLLLVEHGYPIKATVKDWDINPDFKKVSIETIDSQFQSVMPVVLTVIYHKSDEHIATREEICDSLDAYLAGKMRGEERTGRFPSSTSLLAHYNERNILFNLERYGIQVSIDYNIGLSPSVQAFYPKEVIEALERTVAGKVGLKKRKPLWTDDVWMYGHRAFYVPQTPDEAVDKIPEKHLSYHERLSQRRALGEPLTDKEKVDLNAFNEMNRAWNF